jgi:hypothetical protein
MYEDSQFSIPLRRKDGASLFLEPDLEYLEFDMGNSRFRFES